MVAVTNMYYNCCNNAIIIRLLLNKYAGMNSAVGLEE